MYLHIFNLPNFKKLSSKTFIFHKNYLQLPKFKMIAFVTPIIAALRVLFIADTIFTLSYQFRFCMVPSRESHTAAAITEPQH